MGGEMLYILRQRLDAQDIPEEKSRKGETPLLFFATADRLLGFLHLATASRVGG